MLEIITQREAFNLGLDKYFTGKTCKHGHLAQRHVRNGACVDCLKMYAAKYRPVANPMTQELQPWQPSSKWTPTGVTPEHLTSLDSFLADCVEHWVTCQGLMTEGRAKGYAKDKEVRARKNVT